MNPTVQAADLRRGIDESAMTPFQWAAVSVCIMLIMLDGFDVLVMAFTAAHISAEWKLSGAELGVLLALACSAWQPVRCFWRLGLIGLDASPSSSCAWS